MRPARRDGARADDDSANFQLARVLAAQRDAFLRVADDVARMHARVDDARRGVRRRDPGLDPFAEADREEKAAARELDAEIRLGAQRAAAAAPAAAVPGVAAPAGGPRQRAGARWEPVRRDGCAARAGAHAHGHAGDGPLRRARGGGAGGRPLRRAGGRGARDDALGEAALAQPQEGAIEPLGPR